MPHVVDYAEVESRMSAGGLVSLYHRSGAWGFPPGSAVETIGWIGPDDPTIRPQALRQLRRVSPPHATNLARLFEEAWRSHLPGEVWLSPKSHWHFELNFGSRDLLEPLLEEMKINVALLRDRNDGSPISFVSDEPAMLRHAVERLLEGLSQSDFQLTCPGHQAICTIHHHCQLWWQTVDPKFAVMLGRLTGEESV